MSQGASQGQVLVFAAERLSGPDGAVERGDAPIAEDEAVARLRAGGDIVVCSSDRRANRNKARAITEAAFGDSDEDLPHEGRMALPHYHPANRNPEAHAFFEAPPRIAKRRKRKKK